MKEIKSGPLISGEGMYDSQVVLREVEEGREWVTHVKFYYGKSKTPGYSWGHYFTNFSDAIEDFEMRKLRGF